MIEFALIFPMLLVVILGIIDFGFLFQKYAVVTNAAREGARVAILPGYDHPSDVSARVTQYLTAGGLTDPSTTTVGTPQTINVGSQCITVRSVTVTYRHSFTFVGPLVGLIGGSNLSHKDLHATAQMRTEIAAGACP